MYQGTNKTAITSQNMFADALLTLLKANSYENISISELCTAAKVSRQTFYILFQSNLYETTYTLLSGNIFKE